MFNRAKHYLAKRSIGAALAHDAGDGPLLSVVLRAGERSSYLDLALACLEQQVLPNRYWEVLVAVHGCDPETETVFASYAKRHPNWKLVVEQGDVAGALNVALDASQGRIFVFLEEDCLALPDLLMRHALHQQAEESVIVGDFHRALQTHLFSASDPALWGVPLSPVISASEFCRPDWPARLGLRALEFADSPDYTPLHSYFEAQGIEPPHPWFYLRLKNASVSRRMIDSVGVFTGALACRNVSDWSAHEREFAIRLHEHGFKFRFDARTRVLHQAHPERAPDLALRVRDVRTTLCKHPPLNAMRVAHLLMAP